MNKDLSTKKLSPIDQFNHGFTWNLWGSTIFESLKIMHNIFLIRFLDGSTYGLVGMLFATIYLASRLADFGSAYTLAPFFYFFTKSKQTFKAIFLRQYLMPVLPIAATVTALATYWTYQNCTGLEHVPYLLVVPLLIFTETIRCIFRQFLHIAFKSKPTILIELFIFVGYLALVWGSYAYAGSVLSSNLIFVPYCADSLIALSFFMFLMWRLYQALPNEHVPVPENLFKRMATTRLFNYLLHLNRQLFTSNMVTPLFAVKFGLKQAGLFYFASTIARSLHDIIKSTVGHPGNALLATLKENGSKEQKKSAFEVLSAKLVIIVVPIIIFLVLNYGKLLKLSFINQPTSMIITFSIMYLLITFSELFFILYEQFYILEEAASSLFSFKLLEIIFFYTFVVANDTSSPVVILLSIVSIRALSFLMVSLNAFYRWGIKPNFKLTLRFLSSSVGISLLASLFI
ncbi:hypothetical protein K2X40_05200 [Candidatus Babeliales bacterium]|nr:hypothetical protein [Candidatus Babeliales bacterium]